MLARLRQRLTYANVMATLAVFMVLGGGAYAATRLPANSVGSKQLRNNAVTSSKVKDRSLLAKDFKSGQLPAGPRGPQGAGGARGPQGTTGSPGSALAFAHITPTGDVNSGWALDAANSKNVSSTVAGSHGAACVDVTGATPRNAVAQLDQAVGFSDDRIRLTLDPTVVHAPAGANCPAAADALVVIYPGNNGSAVSRPFYIVFN
jgi:hypothetical protein